ncbi:MAG: succinate dehydrogenase cytochrome b subunit [Calditrichaeota bacterium]|nr:succinate dehydrogenase cytochrome b subunit [Calditrichota bacterium]MCB0316882.1 succinate dehydrogenase cytochrome b subunit [Calditrichota bacterium]
MASQSISAAYRMTVAKKVLMALSGLFLVLFVIIHMVGNLSFLLGGADAFNKYSHTLISLGPLLYVVEAGLVLAFVVHAWNGISISLDNSRARPVKYRMLKSAGKPSKKTISSTTMIYTGLILLVFVIIHVKTFKYGPYYSTMVNGVEMRDLYRLVVEVFKQPLYTFGYLFTMLLLGYHLRHGFWSAFQSLGTNHPKYSGAIYTIGIAIAVIVAFGFLAVPLAVYFT